MTLLQLQYFLKLAEIRHFTNAAKALYISQPNLSYAMNELEKELGVSLFLRQKSKVELSEYGTLFLPFAKKAIEAIEEGETLIHSRRNNELEAVSIVCAQSVSMEVLQPALKGFTEEKGTVPLRFRIKSTHDEVLEDLLANKSDLGIVYEPDKHLETFFLTRQYFYALLSASSPNAKREYLTPKDIAEETLIMDSNSTFMVQFVRDFFSSVPLKTARHIIKTGNKSEQVMLLLNNRNAVLFGTPSFTHGYDNIKMVPLKECTNYRDLYLAYSKERKRTESSRIVFDHICDYYRESAEQPANG